MFGRVEMIWQDKGACEERDSDADKWPDLSTQKALISEGQPASMAAPSYPFIYQSHTERDPTSTTTATLTFSPKDK